MCSLIWLIVDELPCYIIVMTTTIHPAAFTEGTYCTRLSIVWALQQCPIFKDATGSLHVTSISTSSMLHSICTYMYMLLHLTTTVTLYSIGYNCTKKLAKFKIQRIRNWDRRWAHRHHQPQYLQWMFFYTSKRHPSNSSMGGSPTSFSILIDIVLFC